MWAQRLISPGQFGLVDVAAPDPSSLADGQVLVRVAAGGVCGSDLPFFRGGTSPDGSATADGFGRPGFPLHEIAGQVLASRDPSIAVGAWVVGWASAFDGLAEQVVTDGDGLATYDPDLSAVQAITIQPLACVLYAVEQLTGVDGARAAVLGQGPIGLLFSHVLADRGAVEVIGVDRVDRSDDGPEFGVHTVVREATDRWAAGLAPDQRPDIVVEAIGHQAATINHAINAVADRGQIYYFGIPDESSYAVDLRLMLRKNLTLRTGATRDRRRVLTEADDYLRRRPLLAKRYITDVLPATDATEAFTRAATPRPGQAKIVLEAP